MARKYNTLCPNEIKKLISKGRAVVIYERSVLDLTKWIPKHPGGDKVVFHMIGKDATDEMNAYHSAETISLFKRWKIGEIDYTWENLLPPIQGGIYIGSDDPCIENEISDTSTVSCPNYDKGYDSLSSAGSGATLGMSEVNTSVSCKALGFPKGEVSAKVKQSITVLDSSNIEEVYPVNECPTVVDPKVLNDNYDHSLARKDLLEIPSLDYQTQENIRVQYQKLHKFMFDKGFYECNYWNYVREIVKILSLFLYSFSFFKLNYLKASALFMGLAWHQMTFIAHDAGHVSISHNYEIDNLFGMIIADWFGGLSLGWWKRNHNVHHLITNDPVHDPDIQHLPFFAVSVRLFDSVYSTYYEKYLPLDAFARQFLKIQDYLYYPILCFGRFNLYRLSWMHLINGDGPRKGKAAWFRYFELAGLSFFFYWFFYLLVFKSISLNYDRFMYVLISHVATMLVHVQITLSHFAMSTADLGQSESFPLRQLRTTMDVDCPLWLDFLHGGLQFQAIHHLFPRLPRHNLRKAQPYVIDFCSLVGLHYSIYGFGKGNEIVIGKLGEIAKQCSIMLEATKKLKDID